MKRKIPSLLIINPELMIHEHKLKGLDLLVYAWFTSVYNLTAKAVFVNKTYLADIFDYDVRNIRRCIDRLVKRGLLKNYNGVFVPLDGMTKQGRTKSPETRTKSPDTRTKSPTINETIIIQEDIKEEFSQEEIDKMWNDLLKEINGR